MSSIKLIFCSLFLVIITACSWVEPFVDRRRDAGQPSERLYVGRSKPNAPVVCYNSWVSSKEEVKDMALQECKKHGAGNDVEPVGEAKFACTLFAPAYIKFDCVDKNEETKKNNEGNK